MFGLLGRTTNFPEWRCPLKLKRTVFTFRRHDAGWLAARTAFVLALLCTARMFAQAQGPVKITLDEAIQLALQHNHNLLAGRTAIQQNQAQEITANLRPNPNLFVDWDYLPAFTASSQNSSYIQNQTEADAGLSYLIERGKKGQIPIFL
jgi:outer membrane protein TolC